jgi:hypothetical protein
MLERVGRPPMVVHIYGLCAPVCAVNTTSWAVDTASVLLFLLRIGPMSLICAVGTATLLLFLYEYYFCLLSRCRYNLLTSVCTVSTTSISYQRWRYGLCTPVLCCEDDLWLCCISRLSTSVSAVNTTSVSYLCSKHYFCFLFMLWLLFLICDVNTTSVSYLFCAYDFCLFFVL